MKAVISPKKHSAVIFDLDGVITKTASVHAMAWKRMFDDFLRKRAKKEKTPFIPFDEKTDYLLYVDGKPRLEGIQSFLDSRNIKIPEGTPLDSPHKDTVWGLGNRKNKVFLDTLNKEGVEVYYTTIELIKKLREQGFKTALISSSKNCGHIIEQVGAEDLFDAKIDGLDQSKLNIKGKPAPDVFLLAAKKLGVDPKRTVVIEDAISGVQAGRKGGFAEVIGVDRGNISKKLLENGADVVVKDLIEVSIEDEIAVKDNALEKYEAIEKLFQGKTLAIFLDYDGTLTPIVSHPSKAKMDAAMKKTLKKLCERHHVAIISGRDRKDVESLVQIPTIFYAGSHGFDIAGPEGQHYENKQGKELLPQLDAAEEDLKKQVSKIKGAWVERKKYSIAIHYRQVIKGEEKQIEEIVSKVHSKFANALRITTGKKIFELLPAIDWNKGKALEYLLKLLKLDKNSVFPIYIGDDVTDEDAFKVIENRGLGIAVQDRPQPTAASYTLKDGPQVNTFLSKLAHLND